MKLADIQITHVQNMVIELANKGYKKSTIRSTVSVVSSCLERAVIGKMLLFNPCRGIVYPEITNKNFKPVKMAGQNLKRMTNDEIIRFFDVARDTRYYELYILLLFTGMRIGEACALEWKDVDFQNNYLHVYKTINIVPVYYDDNGNKLDRPYYIKQITSPKRTASIRKIPLFKAAVDALYSWREKQLADKRKYKRYFGKSVSKLTVSEAAVLAGITQNPTEYNPITEQQNNEAKRKIILKNMLDQKYITEDEYEEALGDDVYSRIQDINKEKRTSSYGDINSYYVDAVIENVVSDLKQKLGYTETQAYNAIYREGLKIYTCQDQSLQKICDDVINNDKYYQKNTKSYLSYQLKVKKSDGETELYTEGDVRAFINDAHKKRISFYFKNRKKAEKYIKMFKKKNLDKHDKILSESINLIKQPQASFVLMEQSTGKVRAIVGGRGEKTANRTLNRAASSKRQPGSTFKVLSTYLPALDTSGFTLANVMDDAPYKYPGTNKRVKDWDSSGYKGLTSLRQGIVDSVNIVTVKTFQKVTPQTGFDYLLNLGFTTLVDRRETSDGQIYSDIQLPTALGGLTDGVTNVELTAAYAAIANGGTYIKPVYYTKIVDSKGNVLLQNSKSGKKVMKNTTAWLLTDAMKDVIKRGTGKKAAFKKIKMPQAGKTGTTSDNTDFWFEGYTPYYTAGIWLGYDSMFTQMSGSASKIMWRDIMEKVHKVKKLKNKNFKKPEDIITRKICKKCGKLAVYGLCDRALDGNDIKTEYFARGTQPKESCDCHVKYTFSNSTGHMAETGASASTNDKVYLNKDESTYKAQTKDTPYLIPGWLK